jgi:class 3 adenylate cyclase/tetratricopeptide (TPR) repeat protein
MVVARVGGDVSAGERLKPYVPRLVVEWLREAPDVRHQAVQGSLAFVDISGFTQLTEKLARRGKVGAEEVSDTLNAIFTQLLDVAYEYDAGLLKWGGDALLLLFDGEDHARRCCRAAAGMQEALDRIGRLRVGGTTVTLRMSVGIHSGAFDFFLVGDSHRELIITGPAATTTVAMESMAEAGEIAVSAATAEFIGAGHVGRHKGDVLLLERAPDVRGNPAPDIGDVSDIDLPSCVPVELRKQLLIEQGEAEHRSISVAFLQFWDTDDLLARRGPAPIADALYELVSNVQSACERFAVTFFATDINSDGGKIILVTGAPWSGGNDEERLLRAVRMIMDRPGDIAVRIGVNSGRAFTCDFGPTYRRTYQIYGDAVNLAARVMAKGQAGQVLATAATLARSRTAYELEELEPFLVKGKSEPVHASVVGAVVGSKEVERAATPLVGRDEEMAALTGAADAARRGEGRVVELIGEPGIGKSRLVEELEARSQIASFWAVCDEYESSTPYFSFRGLLHHLFDLGRDASPSDVERILRRRVAQAAPELEPWIPLLGAALGLDLPATPETDKLDERFVPDRTAETLLQLLTVLRADPTLFVFDDVHWMDEASVRVLTLISEQVADRPWLLLVTRRDVTTGFAADAGPHVVALRPPPLSGDAAAELAKVATEDVPLPPHVLEALTDRSGGNPFFLGELVAAALAGAALDELPGSVEALMAANIDRLEPSERTVLRYAAVLGASFETSLLAEALHEEIPSLDDELWDRLEEFLGEDEPGVLRFRHALIRDASYEGLPYRRRRDLHARVGQTIERRAGERADDEAVHLSLHFFHAHDFEKAWRYSRIAGERAAAIYANVEAAAMLERALGSVSHLRETPIGECALVWETLGDVTLRLSEFNRAETAYRASRRLLKDSRIEEARLLQKEAMVPLRLGRHSIALRRLNRGWRQLEGVKGVDAAAQRARLFAWCGTVRQYQRRPRQGIDWCRRAIREAERSKADDALAQAYFILDWAYLALGAPEEAGYSQRAIEIYERLGDLDRLASVLNNLGGWAYLDGRWEEAVDFGERSKNALEQIGDQVSASIAAFNIAEIRADQGKIEGIEAALRDVLRVQKAAGNLFDVALTTSVLGRQLARAGRFEEAEALLEEAGGLIAAEGDDVEFLTTGARRVECFVLQGETSQAVALSDELLAIARAVDGVSVQIAMLHRLRGWALAQGGQIGTGRKELEESLRIAGLRDENYSIRSADYETALSLDALAELDRLLGRSTSAAEKRRDEILRRLGVVAIPKLPLARPDSDSSLASSSPTDSAS